MLHRGIRPAPTAPVTRPSCAPRRSGRRLWRRRHRADLVNTGPENTGTPDVSGFYTRLETDPAAICTPTNPPAGGTVILGTFTDTQPIKLYQNGTRITIAYVNTPQLPADTGRSTSQARHPGHPGLGDEGEPAQGRQFYVDLTGSAQLTASNGGTKYTGMGTTATPSMRARRALRSTRRAPGRSRSTSRRPVEARLAQRRRRAPRAR